MSRTIDSGTSRRETIWRAAGKRAGAAGFLRKGLMVLIALAFAAGVNPAQQQQPSAPAQFKQLQQEELAAQDTTFRNQNGGFDPNESINRERRLKALNAQRQKAMMDDTNKLLQLTEQLNTEVSSGHQQTLNGDQLRRVAEIEKLAKGIREKMSDAIGPTPKMMDQPSIIRGANFP